MLLARLLSGTLLRALLDIRLRIGNRILYPGVPVYDGSLGQTLKTLNGCGLRQGVSSASGP